MVEPWVKQIVEEVCGTDHIPEVGRKMKHSDGRTVLVTSGQYWGNHGVSNFWNWKEVKDDGSFGKEECGYGYDLIKFV